MLLDPLLAMLLSLLLELYLIYSGTISYKAADGGAAAGSTSTTATV